MFEDVLVVDFEAYPDTLGIRFPVEIGVASPSGAVSSTFIKPKSSWSPGRPEWERHAWLLEQAKERGRPAEFVSQWASRNLSGRTLLSDATWIDQPLLDRLLEGIGHGLKLIEFFPFVERECLRLGISRTTVNAWINEIDATRGDSHRAGEDAKVRADLLVRIAAHPRIPSP